LKTSIVEKDELDRLGIRNVLNFGHTVGHALELSVNYELTHGEAISIGMIAAARLSIALGKCDGTFLQRLQGLLERAQLPTSFPDQPGLYERVLAAMQMDKKFRDGKNLFVLPTGVGSWQQQENVPWEMVPEALRSVLVPLL
jgi:3-dehydroquinate synthase